MLNRGVFSSAYNNFLKTNHADLTSTSLILALMFGTLVQAKGARMGSCMITDETKIG
jgi:hypothetical protein